jgi:type I restriction enzyme S subunit
MMLPNGWAEVDLGQIADFIMGQAPPGEECNIDGDGTPFVKAGEFGSERPIIREWTTRPLKMAQESDVFICVVGATAGKINLGADCAIGRSVAAIRPSNATAADFLYPRLKSEIHRLRGASTGTAQGVISREMLGSIPIALPPIAEQRRIVAKLDALTARLTRARAELERVPVLTRSLRNQALHAAFRGALTMDYASELDLHPVNPRSSEQLRSKFRTNIADTEVPFAVPNSWRWCRLPELGELDRGKSRHRPRNDKRLFGGDHPFIQTGDVRAAGQYLKIYTETYSDLGLEQSRKWPVGTVCITIAANIAETTILGIEACFPDSVVGFTPDPNRATSEYIEYFIRTAKSDLAQFAPATAQKNINLDTLSALFVPTPPIEEQKEIVRRLSASYARADRLEAEAARSKILLDRLESAILAKAFKGELVPQDSNDEPATQLLDRIRAKRVSNAAAKSVHRGKAAKPYPSMGRPKTSV